MKLIDKEALLLALRKKRYSKQSLDLIESQPVVDAIPVAWLKKNYLGDLRIAGGQPVSRTVKKIIECWEQEKRRTEFWGEKENADNSRR